MTRLFLNVGQKDGIRPGDIVGAIANEAQIPGKAIGQIEIKDTYAFVEVPNDVVQRVVAALGRTRLRGREVRTAYDGATGLEVIRAQHPALVFLDLGMPDMDGYEVASAVRRDPALRDVRLVALTGWGAEEDRRRSQEAGFDYHLVKPVDASTLESVLSTLGREVTMHEAAP